MYNKYHTIDRYHTINTTCKMILLYQHALYNIHLRGNCVYTCLHTLTICQMNTQTIMNYTTWQSNHCLVTFCYWPIINSLQSTLNKALVEYLDISMQIARCVCCGCKVSIRNSIVVEFLPYFRVFPRNLNI